MIRDTWVVVEAARGHAQGRREDEAVLDRQDARPLAWETLQEDSRANDDGIKFHTQRNHMGK